MEVLRWLVFSNVWVALAAPSILGMSALLLNFSPDTGLYLFVYAATLFTYNIQRLFKAGAYLGPQTLGRHRWIWDHRPALHLLTVLSALVALVCVFFVPFGFLVWLSPAAFISALYFIPFYPSEGKWKRLRDVPLLKINLVGFTWTWALVAAPALAFDVPWQEWWPLFGFEFFLCFGLTVPFDIRDSKHDRAEGTRTFVSEWGIRRAKWFSIASLLTGLFFLPFGNFAIAAYIVLTMLVMAASFSVYLTSEHRDELYYGFWLDGFIVVQGPLVFLLGSLL